MFQPWYASTQVLGPVFEAQEFQGNGWQWQGLIVHLGRGDWQPGAPEVKLIDFDTVEEWFLPQDLDGPHEGRELEAITMERSHGRSPCFIGKSP